jgi:Cd2+/Zn2+-exporting ATPase
MSIAVTGAVLIGQWPEAAMVMFLFTVAELIEARSLDRARNAISGLMQMTPEQATVQQADGNWVEQEVKTIELGARCGYARRAHRPGRRGVSGSPPSIRRRSPAKACRWRKPWATKCSPAPSTRPARWSTGDGGGEQFDPGADHPRRRAGPGRAGADPALRRPVLENLHPGGVPLALAVAIIPPLFMGAVWFDWIYRALVLLVVACPCALVISTPVTIVSGLAAAARKGILIKGGVYLEGGRKLDYLALDKTGTITHGKPVQTDYLSLDPLPTPRPALAAALAGRSDHPVSLAIANAAVDKNLAAADCG